MITTFGSILLQTLVENDGPFVLDYYPPKFIALLRVELKNENMVLICFLIDRM